MLRSCSLTYSYSGSVVKLFLIGIGCGTLQTSLGGHLTLVICEVCRLEKMHHAKNLCMGCYQRKYRSEADPLGSAQQVQRARTLVRKLGTRMIMDATELQKNAAPYFALPEELMHIIGVVNQIRQREISNTDAEAKAFGERVMAEANVDNGHEPDEPSKVSVKKQTAKLVTVFSNEKR
jgi:hypothetical protein